MGRDGGQRPSRVVSRPVHTLRSLDQIKVLADPLRIRLLEAFCQESTTKQVALRLGEKPTKLYHHVGTLERVGLVKLTRTRQNRGTLEKYYLSVARTFEVDSRALSAASTDPAGTEARSFLGMASTVFDSTRDELRELLLSGGSRKALEEEGLLSYCEVDASREALLQFRDRLRELLESLAQLDDADPAGRQRYRLTLAYFPLPPRSRRGRRGAHGD